MVWFAIASLAVSAGSAYMQNQQAKRAQRRQLSFAERQYQDWEQIFGNPMKQMSGYINSLSPEKYAAVGLENYEIEYSKALERLDADFAQRGLTNSGLAVQARTDLESQRIMDRVGIRRAAEDEVMNRRMQYLSMSSGNNAVNNMQSILNNNAANAMNQANQANANFASSAGNFAQTMYDLYGNSAAKTNTTTAR